MVIYQYLLFILYYHLHIHSDLYYYFNTAILISLALIQNFIISIIYMSMTYLPYHPHCTH